MCFPFGGRFVVGHDLIFIWHEHIGNKKCVSCILPTEFSTALRKFFRPHIQPIPKVLIFISKV